VQYINLLPQEMRPKATTPTRVIVAIYIGVAISFALLMWALYLQIGILPIKEEKVTSINTQINILKAGVADHDRLQLSIKEIVRKDGIVSDLIKRRVKWGRKLDLIWDVVSNSRSTWIKELSISEVTTKVKTGARKTIDVKMPVLLLKLRAGNFEKQSNLLQRNSENMILDFIDSYRANEELMRGFEIVAPKRWRFVDDEFKKDKRIYLDYDLSMKALPFDEKAGRRMKSSK
jgi:hypothetical protein